MTSAVREHALLDMLRWTHAFRFVVVLSVRKNRAKLFFPVYSKGSFVEKNMKCGRKNVHGMFPFSSSHRYASLAKPTSRMPPSHYFPLLLLSLLALTSLQHRFNSLSKAASLLSVLPTTFSLLFLKPLPSPPLPAVLLIFLSPLLQSPLLTALLLSLSSLHYYLPFPLLYLFR